MSIRFVTSENAVEGLKLVKIDKNGSKYYHNNVCTKCGGHGRISMYQYVDNGICFKCGGSGRGSETIILRTEEYQAKLEAKREAKCREKAPGNNKRWLEKLGFNENGNIFIYLGNTFHIKDQLKELGARYEPAFGWYSATQIGGYPSVEMNEKDLFEDNVYGEHMFLNCDKVNEIKNEFIRSQQPVTNYVGDIGDKIQIDVTLVNTKWFDGMYGSTCFNTMRDSEGNIYVWKTTKEVPETATIKGTIKEHKEYNGTKQTILTRCKVL